MAAVIFDLDGTLVDSAPDIHAAVNRMLLAEGEAPLDFEAVKRFIGNGVPTLIARVMVSRGRAGEDIHARWLMRFMADYAARPAVLTRVYPGVPDALEALRKAGHGLGICTNKPEAPARHVLEAFGMAGFFSAVMGGDSLAVQKPDPAPLHAVAQALGDGPVIFVGDSEVDSETAKSAGVPFLLFTGGYRKNPVEAIAHHARFEAFEALPGLVAACL
jgi:phosphoglycolate phosphatase